MIPALAAAFGANAAACATPTDANRIEVFDCYDCAPAARRSYIRTALDQPIHFTLENPTQAPVVFTALDNCLFSSADVARCDFMLGNFQKLFFVEIKEVNAKHRSKSRNDAVEQLDSSLSAIKVAIDLQETELIAVMNIKAKKAHPLQTAKKVAMVVYFKDNHNAKLVEGDHAVF
jgi:hypothetical protein